MLLVKIPHGELLEGLCPANCNRISRLTCGRQMLRYVRRTQHPGGRGVSAQARKHFLST